MLKSTNLISLTLLTLAISACGPNSNNSRRSLSTPKAKTTSKSQAKFSATLENLKNKPAFNITNNDEFEKFVASHSAKSMGEIEPITKGEYQLTDVLYVGSLNEPSDYNKISFKSSFESDTLKTAEMTYKFSTQKNLSIYDGLNDSFETLKILMFDENGNLVLDDVAPLEVVRLDISVKLPEESDKTQKLETTNIQNEKSQPRFNSEAQPSQSSIVANIKASTEEKAASETQLFKGLTQPKVRFNKYITSNTEQNFSYNYILEKSSNNEVLLEVSIYNTEIPEALKSTFILSYKRIHKLQNKQVNPTDVVQTKPVKKPSSRRR